MAGHVEIMGVEKGVVKNAVAKNAAAIVEGVGVKWDSGTLDVCGAGDNACGIALETMTGDGVKTVSYVCLNSPATVKVKVGTAGTATQGLYAECGTAGFTNRTLGGGTTVRYIQGKFAQSGVAGDLVGLEVGQFAGVSS